MSDDIVTRLREECAHSAAAKTLPSWHFAAVVWEAANEIERLRKQQIPNSLVLGPHDTLIIHVPIDTPKDVCQDMTQNVHDQLKGRIVVVRSDGIQAVRFQAE